VMVTGDAPATAAIVARAVGLDGAVCPPGPIPDSVHPEQFAVYAGVLPEDKYKLVKAFQKGGHTVGMCGDGANDAPALRQAQIGIAVSTATDVAKSAAGMVLTEAGLGGIVAAVKEGRITFQRIQTYTLNAIIKKIVTVLFLIVGLMMTGAAILTPLLMVIVMVTGDFLSMSLTTDNVRASPTPNAWRIGNLTKAGVTMGVCLLTFCTGVLAVGKYGMNLGIEALRTLAFLVLVIGSQAAIYAIRERRHLWGSRPSLLLAVSSVADIAIASTLAVGGIAMAPIPVLLVGGTLAAAVFFAFILDLLKVPVFVRLGIAQSPRHRHLNHVIPDRAKRKGIPMTEPSAGKPGASDSESGVKAEPKPEAIAELNSAVKVEPMHEAKTKTTTDLTPRIAKRAYELYEEGGRKEGAARQNWEKAESEIRNAQVKAEPPRGTKDETKPVVKVEPTPAAKEQLQPVTKTEPQPETKGAPNTEMSTASQPETRAEPETGVSPQLVQRVHKLYEELGRQDIRTVQDWEKAQEETRKERSAK
jgi:hypothetical protein